MRWSMLCSGGVEHCELGTLRAIGVDEIHIGQSHKFLTLVYQIEAVCLRWPMGGVAIVRRGGLQAELDRQAPCSHDGDPTASLCSSRQAAFSPSPKGREVRFGG